MRVPRSQVADLLHKHLELQRTDRPDVIKPESLLSFADTSDVSSDSELEDVLALDSPEETNT